jgi:hypothetical protein
MRKLIILIVLTFILSSCSKPVHAVIIAKDDDDYGYRVDVLLDSGEVKFMSISGEQFYSGDFEVGDEWNVSCVLLDRCTPLSLVGTE